MDIGERIRYFRMQQNITVNKLANKAGISQSYLRDLELGKKQPTIEYLSYICEALNISLKRFFSDDEPDSELYSLISSLSETQKLRLAEFIKSMIS